MRSKKACGQWFVAFTSPWVHLSHKIMVTTQCLRTWMFLHLLWYTVCFCTCCGIPYYTLCTYEYNTCTNFVFFYKLTTIMECAYYDVGYHFIHAVSSPVAYFTHNTLEVVSVYSPPAFMHTFVHTYIIIYMCIHTCMYIKYTCIITR